MYWWFIIVGLAVLGGVGLTFGMMWEKKDFWRDGWEIIQIISIVLIVVMVALTVVSIVLPIRNKREFNEYKLKYEYVMNVVENMEPVEYANMGVTSTVLEYNSWLNHARASKETYGRWSFYYNLPLEELEYIGVKE